MAKGRWRLLCIDGLITLSKSTGFKVDQINPIPLTPQTPSSKSPATTWRSAPGWPARWLRLDHGRRGSGRSRVLASGGLIDQCRSIVPPGQLNFIYSRGKNARHKLCPMVIVPRQDWLSRHNYSINFCGVNATNGAARRTEISCNNPWEDALRSSQH